MTESAPDIPAAEATTTKSPPASETDAIAVGTIRPSPSGAPIASVERRPFAEVVQTVMPASDCAGRPASDGPCAAVTTRSPRGDDRTAMSTIPNP